MSNQEAIALLRNLEDALDSYCELNEEGKTAFRMAIEALSSSEFPNSSDADTISRQAAIDAVNSLTYPSSLVDVKRKLIDLPTAQPEIIRCNSCKHWTQSTGEMNGYGLGRCDFHDADLVACNGFCYWAERRTDE